MDAPHRADAVVGARTLSKDSKHASAYLEYILSTPVRGPRQHYRDANAS